MKSTPAWHVVTFVLVAILATIIAVAGSNPVQALAAVALVRCLVELLEPPNDDDRERFDRNALDG